MFGARVLLGDLARAVLGARFVFGARGHTVLDACAPVCLMLGARDVLGACTRADRDVIGEHIVIGARLALGARARFVLDVPLTDTTLTRAHTFTYAHAHSLT